MYIGDIGIYIYVFCSLSWPYSKLEDISCIEIPYAVHPIFEMVWISSIDKQDDDSVYSEPKRRRLFTFKEAEVIRLPTRSHFCHAHHKGLESGSLFVLISLNLEIIRKKQVFEKF